MQRNSKYIVMAQVFILEFVLSLIGLKYRDRSFNLYPPLLICCVEFFLVSMAIAVTYINDNIKEANDYSRRIWNDATKL